MLTVYQVVQFHSVPSSSDVDKHSLMPAVYKGLKINIINAIVIPKCVH